MTTIAEFETSQKADFRKSTANRKIKEEQQPLWGAIPPSQYLLKYGKLTPMGGPTPLTRAFANGTAGHRTPLVSRMPVEVYAGVRSFDTPLLTYLRNLSNLLNKECPKKLDDNLFTPNGVHATFDRLRCPAGYFQSPMSYTAVDNTRYRKELGLPAGYTPRQKRIAQEVWKLVAQEIEIAKINVPKLSTGGMRRFTSDVQWKLAYAEWLFEPDRFERMLDAVAKNDWSTLANEYEALYATYIQKRGQVDEPGKARRVFDLEYALSGGEKGRIFETDKKVVINGVDYPDFSAIRARVVHAGPWVINCFLQLVSTCTMKSLFKRFPQVFHVNTPDEIKMQVDGKHVFCSDVTEYDRSMPRDAIEVAHDVMKEFWDERIVKASWRLVTAPYYSKPLELGGKVGVWVKDPTNWKDEVFAGNRSGHAWTSLIAKVNKVIESMFIIDLMYPLLGRAKEFLDGRLPMGLVNNGDDEIIWAKVERDLVRFKELRKPEAGNGQYVVSPEIGNGFSGNLLVKPTSELIYFPSPRLQTPFEKLWVPERSIGGRHRRYWPIGVMARVEAINKTELGRGAWSASMSQYRKDMAPHYGDFNEILIDSVRQMDVEMDALSGKDREVLEEPDKLAYKYDSSEISQVVLDKIVANIPPSVVERLVSKYYKGHIK